MRIGFDIGPLAGKRTGVGTYCYHLLKHLLKTTPGHEIVGLCPNARLPDLGELKNTLKYRRIPLPARWLYGMWTRFGAPRVDRLLRGVEVYHATNYFLPPTESARRVVSVYDLCFVSMPHLCSPKVVSSFAQGLERFVREADAVLTMAESTKADLVRRFDIDPARISVTSAGVDEGFAPLPRDAAAALLESRYGLRGPFLLFVGTLDPRKNVPALIRAFAKVSPHIPHRLVLIGPSGWGAQEVFEAVEAHDLAGRVSQMGFLRSRSELPAFYSAADAFVFPSLYEGFGLPLLEAMACDCPVIAARNSSIPEVVGDAGILVDTPDEESLAAAVMQVLEDGARRASLIARGREQATRFSWDACARATWDVYRRLAECSSS